MSPAYLFEYDARSFELKTDDDRIPVPPGEEKPPVEEPPSRPHTEPNAPVEEPEPEEPQRLRRVA
ncbi:hypothetical protein [Candidatus Korobacter versatilis]|uniref:hypothetical protein n=1 Tax=Candidatus Korobacter versatilis TaxID=658062 RepID=UPI0003072F88|nr:hypothetical protein [Candidatus Koribacter versatilis]